MKTNHITSALYHSPAGSMSITTQMASVNEGAQGLYFDPLVDPIGQQLTNTVAALAAMHGIWR